MQQTVPEIRQVYRRRPRVEACMRYLVNITNNFHVATRNTSSPTRTHTLWNKNAQRKEGITRTGSHGSMAHVSALGLVLLVYCSTLQQMDVEAKARATEEDRVNTTTSMPGTYDKTIFIDDEKKSHAHPHLSFSWHTQRITTTQASIRSNLDDVVGVQRTAC